MRARRITKENAPVFVTQVTWNREPLFANQENVKLLLEMLRRCKARHPFHMIAYVVLPDHLHVLVEPQEDATISIIMAAVKAEFSIGYRRARVIQGQVMMWQKGYWDHVIRDDADLNRHIDYIHYNPVHHCLVDKPEAWSISSFAWWKSAGHYEDGWGWSKMVGDWIPSAPSWPDCME